LARCSSIVRTLPSSVEEKPHWPEIPSWSRSTYCRGLVDAALEHVFVLELGALGGDDAEDHLLALGHVTQRFERPGALVVELEK